MNVVINNNLVYYQFPIFLQFKNITHGIFTRKGGVSLKPFNSLNIGEGNDDINNIHKNISLIKNELEIEYIYSPDQIHSNEVLIINDYSTSTNKCDAIITNLNNIGLLIKTADCQSIMIFDYVKNVIANIHSGWRGSKKNIIGKTIRLMKQIFSCSPKDFFVGIGPSLGSCCAEFINYKNELPEYFWVFKDSNYYFDFWGISLKQLMDEEVPKKQIYICKICNACNTDMFFSYRKEGLTGRFGSIISLQ